MRFFLLLILLVFCSMTYGQIELSAGNSYDVPLGSMARDYKNGQAFNLTILKGKKYKKERSNVGITIGYCKSLSKGDTLFFPIETVNGIGNGAKAFGDYTSYQLMFSERNDRLLSKRLEFFYGFNVGLNYTRFNYYERTAYTITDGPEVVTRIAVSPMAGITMLITKTFCFSIYGKYLVAVGNSERVFTHFLSPGTSLSLRM